jgi:hypothetical protein
MFFFQLKDNVTGELHDATGFTVYTNEMPIADKPHFGKNRDLNLLKNDGEFYGKNNEKKSAMTQCAHAFIIGNKIPLVQAEHLYSNSIHQQHVKILIEEATKKGYFEVCFFNKKTNLVEYYNIPLDKICIIPEKYQNQYFNVIKILMKKHGENIKNVYDFKQIVKLYVDPTDVKTQKYFQLIEKKISLDDMSIDCIDYVDIQSDKKLIEQININVSKNNLIVNSNLLNDD